MTSILSDLEAIGLICGSQIVHAVPKMLLYFLSMMLFARLTYTGFCFYFLACLCSTKNTALHFFLFCSSDMFANKYEQTLWIQIRLPLKENGY